MSESSLFNIRLGERVRRLARAQKRSLKSIGGPAGIYENAATNISLGRDVSVSTLMAVLYELDAGPSDLEAIYADFAECQRERAHG